MNTFSCARSSAFVVVFVVVVALLQAEYIAGLKSQRKNLEDMMRATLTDALGNTDPRDVARPAE